MLLTCIVGGKSEAVCRQVHHTYFCQSKDLRAVPDGIQSNVYHAHLYNNEIEELKENDFVTATSVHNLYLQNNRISIIHPKAFSAMTILTRLHLQNNKLKSSQFYPKMFYGLTRLAEIQLHNNDLERFLWNMFSPSDHRASDGHPPSLKLSLGGNPVKCDLTSSCWLKEGAEDGWLTWITVDGAESVPQCVDTQAIWPNIHVDCAHFG